MVEDTDSQASNNDTSNNDTSEGAEPERSLEELQSELVQLRELHDRTRDLHLRAEAELRNFRRRAQEERAQQALYANQELVTALLPILDHLQMALEAESEGHDAAACMAGVRMTAQQLADVLAQFGLQPISADGFFDPDQHEAVERVETDEPCEGTILAVVRPGYRMHNHVIRPAQVKVAVAPRQE